MPPTATNPCRRCPHLRLLRFVPAGATDAMPPPPHECHADDSVLCAGQFMSVDERREAARA